MIGEVIQEYLVALGAKIDKPGFREMDQTIQQSGELITRATGSWAANFVKASTIIASAIAGVKAATLGLMTAAAKQDLEMEKYARSMMMSRDAAEQMKRATDALGESVQDITLSPELSERFRELSADGGQMLVGGDFKETMRNFRDLIFQWTRLKQEASYAMTWIGYYLAKYLQKPLAEIRERFREFNDNFVKNISTWTEKAARAIVYILEIGRHFLTFLWDVGKALYNIWDSFPKGVKIATAALAGFWAIMRMSPLGRMITLVSALMLLIDDYYGYMEGKNAALGPLWDKLNEAIERGKELWAEIVPVLEDVYDWAVNVAKGFMEWLDEMSRNETIISYMEAVKKLGKAIWNLAKEIWDFVTTALSALFEGFNDTATPYGFRDALEAVAKVMESMIELTTGLINRFKDLLSYIGKSRAFKTFWKDQGDEARRFFEIVTRSLDVVSKLIKALACLVNGDLEGAKIIGNEIIDFLNGKNSKRGITEGLTDEEKKVEWMVQKYSAQYGVDPNLARAIIKNETGFRHTDDEGNVITSDAGARGIMQLMPGTAKEMGVDPDIMEENIKGGIKYLAELQKILGTNDPKALAEAYNGGPAGRGNADQNYVSGVVRDYGDYASRTVSQDMQHGGGGGSFEPVPPDFGEGKYWIKQHDGVSLEGARPETLFLLFKLAKWFYDRTGRPLVVTAGTNGEHADGEFSHSAGWKLDVNDWGSGAEGSLIDENDNLRGTLAEDFYQYGRSLGAGMNREGEGTDNVHFDISAAGDQWTTGEDLGGVGTGWNGVVKNVGLMREAYAANGFMSGGAAPAYLGGNVDSHNVSVGDIIVNIQGGANATAEELGRSFAQQINPYFQPYGMALAGNNV